MVSISSPPRLIQIHLMLLFIYPSGAVLDNCSNSNTSHVIVYPLQNAVRHMQT